ncbi:hypothetical protein [Halostella pelagica]|uniref:hypothetical protein n=1 Tax=Halostella pelagica TaxID=2583824 RepID=UPI001081E7C6|nr:hypothetical protein [Halostella pelagica]
MPREVDSVFLAGPHPLVERVREWLRDEYRVSTTTGPAAVPRDADPDAAIVDHRPPSTSLDALTSSVDDDCRIAAVVRDPPSSPTAHSLPVDAVLVEPLSPARVLKTLERFDRRLAYADALEALPEVAATRAAVNEIVSSSVPGTAGAVEPARAAWTVAQNAATEHLAEFDAADYRAAFRRTEFEGFEAERTGNGGGSSA